MMTAKKKAEPKVAPAKSKEAVKSATAGEHIDAKPKTKPMGVGDWVMLDGMFEQLHLVAKSRDKEVVTTACGLVFPPSFTKPKGQRCKRCNALRDVTAS